MNLLPVDRALAIYGTIANRAELKGTRERLSRQLRKVFLDGDVLIVDELFHFPAQRSGRRRRYFQLFARGRPFSDIGR